jgi:hypothetical protein
MEGQEHNIDGKIAKVVLTKPIKDPVTKDKFWDTTVVFKRDYGTEHTQTFKDAAHLNAIKVFYPTLDSPIPTEKDFKVADFFENFDENKRAELESCIAGMMEKCDLDETERTSWKDLLASIPTHSSLVSNLAPFILPLPQSGSCYREKKSKTLPIVVTHQNFPTRSRQKVLKIHDQEMDLKLQALRKGDFVDLQVGVTNCLQYPFDFVVAQVIEDVSKKDTTNPETLINFQISAFHT